MKKMQYKAIFIDIDDTLLDYIPCCREAFDAALDALTAQRSCSNAVLQRSAPTSEADLLFDLFFSISGRLFSEAKRGLHTIAEVMELYPAEFIERSGLAQGLTVDEQNRMTDTFKHAFRAAWGKTHALVPDARETLEALRAKGYRLFAASNSFGHLQRSRLEQAGLLHYFEDTYISMDIGFDKPDRRYYEETLRRCGLLPHEVLMVGDSMTTDVLGAMNAGLFAVYFNRRNEPLPLLPPEHASLTVITSLTALLQIL